MSSRPLLDYLAYPDDVPEPPAERPLDPLEARLKDLEARLRADRPTTPVEKPGQEQDLTLSAQIEAILSRKAAPRSAAPQAAISQPAASRYSVPGTDFAVESPGPTRVVLDPPPSVPASNDARTIDQDFLRFTEAVYLIGQAARRFIEEPRIQTRTEAGIQPQPAQSQAALAPSTGDIEALSAVLRETVSVFRSVADDLAVSAGEIRHYATRAERAPERPSERRRPQPARHRDDDEILDLRDSIADLQDRLDDLLQTRRRARY